MRNAVRVEEKAQRHKFGTIYAEESAKPYRYFLLCFVGEPALVDLHDGLGWVCELDKNAVVGDDISQEMFDALCARRRLVPVLGTIRIDVGVNP